MSTAYPAHIRKGTGAPQIQTVAEHCRNTANYASETLSGVSLTAIAYLAGLLHDMGKATEAFAAYIWQAFQGLPVVRGSVNHTFAAVRFLLSRYGHREDFGVYGPLTAEILAYSVGSHHGLFDGVDEKHRSGLLHRMEKQGIDYEEAMGNYLAECTDLDEIDRLFGQAVQEVELVLEKLESLGEGGDEEPYVYLSLLIRLITSALVAGDRQDTKEFQTGCQFPRPESLEQQGWLWRELLERVEEKIRKLPCDTPINQARRAISDQCRNFAEKKGEVIRLNVPTGGGKTLASLRYALAHGAAHQKQRIIFVSPLLSILEQNAAVIRKYIADDSLILEHHSNVVRADQSQEELDESELLMETWSQRLIITTLVQLLSTLFSGKTGCIRRFSSLCGSIIIIDEVQTVPTHLLSLFHIAVGFLASVCDATVVLCSATQPCDEASQRPIGVPVEDMVPYDEKLWRVFRRTKIEQGPDTVLEDFEPLLRKTLEETDSLLVVCNKKEEAQSIFTQAGELPCRKFYLSASMCMAHRRTALDELKASIDPNNPGKTLCVSTQVIEAGVDISFGRVIRLTAGMDSVVQAAGRCNRNGESEIPARVQVVRCVDENLNCLQDIKRGKNASISLLREFALHPESYRNDLTSDEAISTYYHFLYGDFPEGLQDGPVGTQSYKETLVHLLGSNGNFANPEYLPEDYPFQLNQAFKTAGEKFHVFDGDTEDVLVPYGRGEVLIEKLLNLHLPEDLERMEGILKEARLYTVAVYPWLRDALDKAGALVPICGGKIRILRQDFYDETMGLVKEPCQQSFLGV